MPWEISYLEELKVVQTIYTEPITLEDLKDAAVNIIALALEKQTGLFLADCSKFTQSGNTMDIYKLGAFLESISSTFPMNIKEAMVEPSNAQNVTNDLRFFETVANNRMIKVKVFKDSQAAIDWLIE